MNSPLTLQQALIAVAASAIVIYITRVSPFLIFRSNRQNKFISFIDKFTPSMIMAILVIYCFKDINYTSAPYGIPYFICTVLTAVLHLTTKNSMVSILGTTVIYMILIHIF